MGTAIIIHTEDTTVQEGTGGEDENWTAVSEEALCSNYEM